MSAWSPVMWPIWFRSELSSWKDFEILWKFVIFQIFISTVLSNLHSTDVIPHCTDVIPLHVLMLSPQCTEYPPQYWSYPPLYWCYPPTVLNNLHSTEGIPTVLKLSPTCTAVIPHSTEATLHSTDVIPHSTDVIPRMYWRYPPTVLNNLHSTEAIPPQYWCYPPDVLNNLHSTEPTLYGVVHFFYWLWQERVFWCLFVLFKHKSHQVALSFNTFCARPC